MSSTYSVIHGNKTHSGGEALSWAVLILRRNKGIFVPDDLSVLESIGFSEIIYISEPDYIQEDFEAVLKKHPNVKFLVTTKSCLPGEQINMAMNEISSPFLTVVWNDMNIKTKVSPMLKNIVLMNNALCSVPLFHTSSGAAVPSVVIPVFNHGYIKTLYFNSLQSGTDTLFPFDYAGIYNREKFLSAGGFDTGISSAYWQLMDFGFRAHLWGFKIVTCLGFDVQYYNDFQNSDISFNSDYVIFCLKNLAIKYSGGIGYLSKFRALMYILKSGSGAMAAFRHFSEIREWIRKNCFRFKQGSRELVDLWPVPKE